MSDEVIFDESEWPLVKITIPEVYSDAVWERGMSGISAILARGLPFAMCTLKGGPPTAKQRKTITDFMGQHHAEFKAHCRGWAVVADSQVIRGIITAINWLRPPPFEQRAFQDASEAIAWSKQQLRGGGPR